MSEKDRKPEQNGKGDRSRVSDHERYRRNLDTIFRSKSLRSKGKCIQEDADESDKSKKHG